MRLFIQIFYTFFKIGAFTLGGGYAMIPLIQEEVVGKRHWIEQAEFLDLLALAQSAPGILAANTAIFIGYKMRGLAGAIVAVLGVALPSFMIILLIAIFFADYKDNPTVEAVFKGIRPAVVALIAAPLYKMARSANLTWFLLLISVATALAIWLAHLSPIWIIVAAVVCGITIAWRKNRQTKNESK